MRAALFFLLIMIIFPAISFCQEYGNDTQTPVNLEIVGKFEVTGCEPVYDLEEPTEPIIAWLPIVKEIPANKLAEFPAETDTDGNEKVLVRGVWVRIDKFNIDLICDTTS